MLTPGSASLHPGLLSPAPYGSSQLCMGALHTWGSWFPRSQMQGNWGTHVSDEKPAAKAAFIARRAFSGLKATAPSDQAS
jgi:hypothetical protein